MRKNKFVGRQIEVDGRVGIIIYANSIEVLVRFEDKSRTRLAKDHAAFLLLANPPTTVGDETRRQYY